VRNLNGKILKAAVELLLVLDLLESPNTCSCWGFHPFGAWTELSRVQSSSFDGMKRASTVASRCMNNSLIELRKDDLQKDDGRANATSVWGGDTGGSKRACSCSRNRPLGVDWLDQRALVPQHGFRVGVEELVDRSGRLASF